jgi:hypothetical protein
MTADQPSRRTLPIPDADARDDDNNAPRTSSSLDEMHGIRIRGEPEEPDWNYAFVLPPSSIIHAITGNGIGLKRRGDEPIR